MRIPPPPVKGQQGGLYNIPNSLAGIGDVTQSGMRGCARFGSLGCLVLLVVSCCILSLVFSPVFDVAAFITAAAQLASGIIGRNVMDFLPDPTQIILDLAGSGGVIGAFLTFGCICSPVWIGALVTFLLTFIKINANGDRQRNQTGATRLPPPPPRR